MFARRQFTPLRPRPVSIQRDYAAQFERWVGYRLHPHARRVVAFIERQRARRQPQRVIVKAAADVIVASFRNLV